MTTEYKLCDTFQTKCGKGRLTYRPDWAPAPRCWISYIEGTAGPHFATPQDAVSYFKERGMKLDLEKKS